MKILFCTKNDLFGAVILNWVLPRLARHQVHVLLAEKTRRAEGAVGELVNTKYLEHTLPLQHFFPYLEENGVEGELLGFTALARRHGVRIDTVTAINDAAGEALVRGVAPDLILSARFSHIFAANILALPRLGTFNVHPGALPGYAGLGAPLQALLHGEARLGCTVHACDEGIDTGPVHTIAWLPAEPQRSVFEHTLPLYLAGLAEALALLDQIEQGAAPPLLRQDPQRFRYFHTPDNTVMARLAASGRRLIYLRAYCALLRRFWPANAELPAPACLDPVALVGMLPHPEAA